MTTPTKPSYADAAVTAADAGFQSRVQAALYAGIARIGMGSFADQQQRAYFTSMIAKVAADPAHWTVVFTWVLTAYCGLTVDSTDTDLDTAITQLWPAVSGYIAAGGPA